MKSEAKIILMQKDNQGKSLKEINDKVIAEAIDLFGGCSATPAKGYWQDPKTKMIFEDDTLELTIATPNSHPGIDQLLEGLAYKYMKAANQFGVYLRNSQGQVVIVE